MKRWFKSDNSEISCYHVAPAYATRCVSIAKKHPENVFDKMTIGDPDYIIIGTKKEVDPIIDECKLNGVPVEKCQVSALYQKWYDSKKKHDAVTSSRDLYHELKELKEGAYSDYDPSEYDDRYNSTEYNKCCRQLYKEKQDGSHIHDCYFGTDGYVHEKYDINDYNMMLAYINLFEGGLAAQLEWQREVQDRSDAYNKIYNMR